MDDPRPPIGGPCRLLPGRNSLGAGRFANIGIPYPDLMGPFVGAVEITCGALVILGLLTRLAAVPLIIIMLVAIVSTKVPIWLGHDLWIFHVPKLARYGFWSMAQNRSQSQKRQSAIRRHAGCALTPNRRIKIYIYVY
jgi:DoxX